VWGTGGRRPPRYGQLRKAVFGYLRFAEDARDESKDGATVVQGRACPRRGENSLTKSATFPSPDGAAVSTEHSPDQQQTTDPSSRIALAVSAHILLFYRKPCSKWESTTPNCHTDGNGIIIDDNRRAQINSVPYESKTLIFGNLAFNNGGRGILVYSSDNVDVINNTAYHNLTDKNLLYYPNGAAELHANYTSYVNFYNNIAVAAGAPLLAFMENGSTGNNARQNLTYGGNISMYQNINSSFGASNNLIGVDPRFMAPSTVMSSANFHLQPTSPAQSIGMPLGKTFPDLGGKTISATARPNLGAYLTSQ
jgi:parallel beta-helix repeat protein